MAWGGSGTSWGGGGTVYTSGRAVPKHHGLFHKFLGGLGGDVKSLSGIPMGLAMLGKGLATHPTATIQQTGKVTGQQIWHTWSPLFRGHAGEFGHRFVEHPLAPILDVATVFTAGAGSVARLGRIAEATGTISSTSRLARLSRPAELTLRTEKPQLQGFGELSKGTHGYTNPVIRARKEFIHRQLSRLPKDYPGLGMEARYARVLRRQVARNRDSALLPLYAAQELGKKISKGKERGELHTYVHQHIHKVLSGAAVRWQRGAPLHQDWVWLRRPDGPILHEAPAGSYYHPIKDGVWELRKSESSLKGESSIRAAKGGAFELNGNVATIRAIPAKIKSRSELTKGTKRKAGGSFIREDDGTISAGGGYKKTLHEGSLKADEGKKWVQTGPGKFKQVAADAPGPTQLRADHGFVLHQKGKRVYKQEGLSVEKGSEHWSPEKWQHELAYGRLKERMFTRDPRQAMRDGNTGDMLALPKKALDAYMGEAGNTVGLVGKLYKHTTNTWRGLILGVPRFATNNMVGNTLMTIVGDPLALRHLPEIVRHVRGDKAANELLLHGPHDLPYLRPGGPFGNVAKSTFGATQVPELPGRLGRAAQRAETKWYQTVGRWSEEMYRGAMITKAVRSDPGIRELTRQLMAGDSKMKRAAAESQAIELKLVDDPQWAHKVQEHVEGVLGNYEDFNRMEKQVRNVVPFYSWNRAITRHVVTNFKDRPGRSLALYYTGQQGLAETQKKLGDIPHFLAGAIPLSDKLPGFEAGGDRTNILSTQGINPYQTFEDEARGVLAALPGGDAGGEQEALGQNLGPIGQTAIEFFSGTDLLTGQPQHKALPQLLWANLGLDPNKPGLPQLRLIKSAVSPTPDYHITKQGRRYDKLYSDSVNREWAAIFGVPIKSMSKRAAKQRKKTEQSGGR